MTNRQLAIAHKRRTAIPRDMMQLTRRSRKRLSERVDLVVEFARRFDEARVAGEQAMRLLAAWAGENKLNALVKVAERELR